MRYVKLYMMYENGIVNIGHTVHIAYFINFVFNVFLVFLSALRSLPMNYHVLRL